MADGVLVNFPSVCYFTSLESLLRHSTSRFLAAVSAESNPDFGEFRYLFSRVLNTYSDPPFEAVWFFSAVTFHDAPDDLRYILNLLSAFTASSPSAAKPLALLAPVVSELFHSAKPDMKIVEAVFKYIRTCSSRPTGGEVDADAGRLLPVFEQLVKVWSVRISSDKCPFEVLFPLVGDEARQDLKKEGCSVTFLAGVVVAEAFLLRLYLKVQGASGEQPSELHKELRTLAVDSIRDSQEFVGVLLNMLVNYPLPFYSPLLAAHEALVRDVLYDALILDYSVLGGAEVDQADSSLFPIFVSRLVITVDAINVARREEDKDRAMLFTNAFLTSDIPSYLVKWAICEAGTDQIQVGERIAITPHDFLEWLVDLDYKGFKVFGENCSRIKKNLMHDEGRNDNQSRISQSDGDHLIIDEQSHQKGMDTKGGDDKEAVEMETEDNAFMAAAPSVIVMANDIRKRKDCGTEDATVEKFVKYKAEDSTVKDYLQDNSRQSFLID